MAWDVKPLTRLGLTYSGWSLMSTDDETVTMGILFSELRPTLPAVRSPPRLASSNKTATFRRWVPFCRALARVMRQWSSHEFGYLTPNLRLNVSAD